MATAFALAVIAYLTTGMFLHLAYERYMWILLALAASAAYIGLHHRASEDADESATGTPPAPRHARNGGRRTVADPA
jgi:hypothetical protein